MKEEILYLDANAHVPPSVQTLECYSKIAAQSHGHPLSLTEIGRDAATILENARERIAIAIGAQKSSQIIFTSGCTQACQWAIEIIAKQDYDEVLCSPMEHPAVRDPVTKLFHYSWLDYPILSNHITNKDAVVITHLQNEIGIINPVKFLKEKAGFIFSDMSQSLGKIPVNVSEMNVDLAAFGAHKFGGINGVGFLYLKDPQYWIPFGTGSRYFTDRTGTPDVAGIVASAFALEQSIRTIQERHDNALKFQTQLELGLKERGWKIVGEKYERAPHISFVQKEGEGIHQLLKMNQHKIYCGLGSACGSNAAGLSPTLYKMGYKAHPHDFMRISQWGNYNDKDAKRFLAILDKD